MPYCAIYKPVKNPTVNDFYIFGNGKYVRNIVKLKS